MEIWGAVLIAAIAGGAVALIGHFVRRARRSADKRTDAPAAVPEAKPTPAAAPKLHYSRSFGIVSEPEPAPEEEPAVGEPMWTCMRCGNKNPQSASACTRCGLDREPPEPAPAETKAPLWTCVLCGAKNRAADSFCTSCGTKRE